MGLTRISMKNGVVIIEVNRIPLRLNTNDMKRVTSSVEFKQELETKFGRGLPFPVFYHKNRNGTMTVVTGEKPDVWPEDEV